RKLYGARISHTYTTELRTFSELLYLGLTTGVGNQTLGEEYCDVVQVEDDTLRLPSIARRVGYIVTTILLPYSLNRILPAFRRRVRAKLERNLRKPVSKGDASTSRTLQSYVLANLDTVTSPAPVYAVSLAVFYFSGAYYHLGKRIWGLRYIFTRRVETTEQRVGYEVLGVLLVLQLAVQGWLHIQNTVSSTTPTVANAGLLAGGTAVLDNGVEVSLDPNAYSSNNALLLETGENTPPPEVSRDSIQKMTHTPILSTPR
ncbi:hypothetical protein LTS18_002283, partial [Coniosporium uncinatum]